jgi:hypothetical protein
MSKFVMVTGITLSVLFAVPAQAQWCNASCQAAQRAAEQDYRDALAAQRREQENEKWRRLQRQRDTENRLQQRELLDRLDQLRDR